MKVKLYKPQSPLLQQYIECFYTLRRNAKEGIIIYKAFPSTMSMVSMHVDTKIELQKETINLSYSPRHRLETKLVCNFGISDTSVRYEGQMDEIVVYFKPLGINAFLEKDFSEYFTSYYVTFDPFEDFREAIAGIFTIDDDHSRIAALETYLLSKHRGFKHSFLHKVIDEIMDSGGAGSIAETARRNGISRTTLNKHFDQHIGTTPSQFKKIVRFRNAMKRHREKISAENLTDISQSAEYFDQSHMIKDFRTLTQYPPKAFFSKISSLEDGHINWLFL